MLSHESIEETINRRIQVLTHRDGKTELEHKELDSLIAHHCKLRIQQAKHAENLPPPLPREMANIPLPATVARMEARKRKYRKMIFPR